MLPVFRRCLLAGASTVLLAGPVPPLGLSGAFGTGQAVAQEAAPEVAPEAEPKKRRSRGREKKAMTTAPGMQQATPVAIFGDWNVFANGQGKTRVCYAIAQPQARSVKTLKRDTAYLFVTVRKAENVANEVAVMLGFPAKPASSQGKMTAAAVTNDPALTISNARYGLVIKDGNAWLQNPAEETRLVTEMARTAKLQVKVTSLRGNTNTDDYALAGFGDAMKRTREECK
ncbi:invasion associated locus b family protein [Methylobacterium sp. BTF04]|uniref:invasion associated locus b family protein n=1 Tax=Methylobacterium sp. BTF04 TaxID=2708300 RepID=UPI0013D45D53|nr:invasion associated locus b family protein [Methylobacterium sp. BTF04]NEU14225.1 invasion associated locus b family protein [Methylobacterium sp. BTF04]